MGEARQTCEAVSYDIPELLGLNSPSASSTVDSDWNAIGLSIWKKGLCDCVKRSSVCSTAMRLRPIAAALVRS